MLQIKVLFPFILVAFSSFAQQRIDGRVLDAATRDPVASATVTLHPTGSLSILAYTMTAEDGTFTLKRDELPDSVTVTVSGMTIERQSKTLKKDGGPVEFQIGRASCRERG